MKGPPITPRKVEEPPLAIAPEIIDLNVRLELVDQAREIASMLPEESPERIKLLAASAEAITFYLKFMARAALIQ